MLQCQLAGSHNFESQIGAGINAGICLLLAISIPAFGELSAKCLVHPAQQVAKYSYGIYLLHVPALIFVLRYLPGLPLVLKIVTFFALTALLSFVSFHALENPLIRLGKRLTQAAPTDSEPEVVLLPDQVLGVSLATAERLAAER